MSRVRLSCNIPQNGFSYFSREDVYSNNKNVLKHVSAWGFKIWYAGHKSEYAGVCDMIVIPSRCKIAHMLDKSRALGTLTLPAIRIVMLEVYVCECTQYV